MHGLAAGRRRRGDHGRDAEIALGRGRRADADRAVGHPYVHGALVGLRVDRHGLDVELVECADHAHRDLTAVGDEDLG